MIRRLHVGLVANAVLCIVVDPTRKVRLDEVVSQYVTHGFLYPLGLDVVELCEKKYSHVCDTKICIITKYKIIENDPTNETFLELVIF